MRTSTSSGTGALGCAGCAALGGALSGSRCLGGRAWTGAQAKNSTEKRASSDESKRAVPRASKNKRPFRRFIKVPAGLSASAHCGSALPCVQPRKPLSTLRRLQIERGDTEHLEAL